MFAPRARHSQRRKRRPIVSNVLATYSFSRAYVAISKRENAPVVREIRKHARDDIVRVDLKYLSRTQYMALMETLKRKKPKLNELSITFCQTHDIRGYLDDPNPELSRAVLESQRQSKQPPPTSTGLPLHFTVPPFLRCLSPCFTSSLTVLRLDGINFSSVRESAVMILPKALFHTLDSLRIFSVRDCQIGDDQFLMISSELKKCKRLEVLNLRGNMFSDKSVAVVLTLLKVKQEQQSEFDWLKSLRNYETEDEERELEGMLERNPGLVSVDLSKNFLTSATVAKMCEILQTDTTLKRLNLAENLIENDALLELDGLLLRKNSTIELIDLSRNPVIEEAELQRLRASSWETMSDPECLIFVRRKTATTLHDCVSTLLGLLRRGHDFSSSQVPIDQKFATVLKYICHRQLGSQSPEVVSKTSRDRSQLQEEQVSHLLSTMLERVTQLEESAIAHLTVDEADDDDDEESQDEDRFGADLDSSIMDDSGWIRSRLDDTAESDVEERDSKNEGLLKDRIADRVRDLFQKE